ncbi:MAG: UDP-N-acetylmuramoyl-L-alanyl-D-glutamate--2,6-diaminopimelate ligase, partial [Bdellovibrionales bacterium]|nr:UDP-N-acetylmuramoyl-L-alanyl-D-glutamate--2,6-diaminopimelate ligase [Bdellovibrionales bacterium]
PGRLEKVPNQYGLGLFVDYSHTPDALKQALQTLRTLSRGKLTVVFGCGGDRDREKRPEMGRIALQEADQVVITSDNPRNEPPESIVNDILAGISQSAGSGSVQVVVDRSSAILKALRLMKTGDVLLVAGKGHEDYQIIGDRRIYFSDREEILSHLGCLSLDKE